MFKRKPKSTSSANTLAGNDRAQVTTGQVGRIKRLRLRPSKKAVFLGVLAVILLSSPIIYMYTQNVGWFSKPFTPVKPIISPDSTPQEVDTAVAAAREKELDQLIANERNASQKRNYQNELALIYLQQGKQSEALDLAAQVEDSGQTASSASTLAAIYFAQGDYKQAAKYYGIAMERSPKPSRSTERAPYNDYANLKKEAEDAQ
ncbi:hypothetical protein BH09PAT4_BH09PAT4_08190 [soil metagenome]